MSRINDSGALEAVNPSVAGSSNPAGTILMWPSQIPPNGYLLCNGAAFDPALHPELATLFPAHVLPDLRDQFIRGASNVNDTKGLTKHQDTTRMPRTPFTTHQAGGHVHDYQIAMGGSTVYNDGTRTSIGLHYGNNIWTVTNLTQRGGGNLFWPSGVHTHTISGGDSETAGAHVRLAFIIKAG